MLGLLLGKKSSSFSKINREKPEITLSRNHIVYIAELDSSIESKYNEIYGSKLVTPEEKKLIL